MDHANEERHVSTIFVHAGAGFHRRGVEKPHMKVCEGAAKVAMALLRNGGSAVDAVEVAIMYLEDSEITNSGYGSNMTIEGTVECDATVVDHLGRSGAVGAVAQVKNPISLARAILDASKEPLTLYRVPPNFLVGPGATDYAYEQGLVVLPHDGLVSSAARQRWIHWQTELKEAEIRPKARSQGTTDVDKLYYRRPVKSYHAQSNMNQSSTQSALSVPVEPPSISTGNPVVATIESAHPGVLMDIDAPPVSSGGRSDGPLPGLFGVTEDHISDTVGAIAVDSLGNIAAGSSSGGPGMKHRGRIGPAALNGLGTCVLPIDPNDPDKTCVACVTSGTGELIATSLAARTCASRVYYSHRKRPDGSFEEVTEEEAMAAMIQSDFMDYPGVKASHCKGSVGIMTVKKTIDGVYLYFAHNTDTFVLANMSSEDKRPSSVMSRSVGHGTIAQGGKAFRVKKY
ncbi:nucleophile aminohydrolase [Aspergillus granulosus]|uniref:Nucleophile aminohydrolase n=1 Tax=Aspergillus granulosus TaxID=176169 RepID=A0ABR4I2U5_9EURO